MQMAIQACTYLLPGGTDKGLLVAHLVPPRIAAKKGDRCPWVALTNNRLTPVLSQGLIDGQVYSGQSFRQFTKGLMSLFGGHVLSCVSQRACTVTGCASR